MLLWVAGLTILWTVSVTTPVTIITAFMGAPFFLWLMRKREHFNHGA